MSIVGAIIHYALATHHRPNEGVMNYGPYVLTILFNSIGPYRYPDQIVKPHQHTPTASLLLVNSPTVTLLLFYPHKMWITYPYFYNNISARCTLSTLLIHRMSTLSLRYIVSIYFIHIFVHKLSTFPQRHFKLFAFPHRLSTSYPLFHIITVEL